MTVAEIKARNMIKEKSTEQLLDLWMMISNTVSVDAAMVRGWLMDELEVRNPEGFDKWLDTDECKDEELAQYILNK